MQGGGPVEAQIEPEDVRRPMCEHANRAIRALEPPDDAGAGNIEGRICTPLIVVIRLSRCVPSGKADDTSLKLR